MKVLIYTDDYQISSTDITLLKDVQICQDIATFNNTPADFKVAIIHLSHVVPQALGMISLIESVDKVDFVIVYTVELNMIVLGIIDHLPKENLHFVVGGFIRDEENMVPTIEYNPYWLMSTAINYMDKRNQILLELNPYEQKPYYFEVLYGLPKPHRRYVRKAIKKIDNSESLILQSEFLNVMSVDSACMNESDFWEKDIKKLAHTSKVEYRGCVTLPSQIIPLDIYNKTAYSLVCETEYKNEFSFFTEKIAKPIIARRLFIVISGRHYLKNLRKLGFKTFSGVIDESYDEIEDDHERFDAALTQVKRLCTMDQHEVFLKIQEIVEHNYRRIQEIAIAPHKVTSAIEQKAIEHELIVNLSNKGN